MENQDTPKQLGRYEIVRELGKGAMGVVYEGRDPSIGRRVAIKTARRDMLERSGMAGEMMERFLREARAAGMLSHPHIITIYDVGEEEGVAYIAMEYVEGQDLNTLIAAQRRFSIEQVAEWGSQICEALFCAHEQGVVHRDIKPANIMIPNVGPLKVADFGIARTHDSTLTQDGTLMGTPSYMSPEQFMGQKVDARADLFSVGVMLYEMLTGEKPFTGEALTTIMHHILKTDPTAPMELNYLVPEALNIVVMKALAKKPQQRYASGKAMAEALRESVKPNPDMNIVQGMSAEMEQTVIAGEPVAMATVAMRGDALPGTRLSATQSTFAGSTLDARGQSFAGSSTFAAGSTFSGDSSMGMNMPPPDVALLNNQQPAQPAPAASSKVPLAAALFSLVIVLVVAGGMGAYWFNAISTTPTTTPAVNIAPANAATPPTATPPVAPPDAPPAVPAAAVVQKKVNVAVYTTGNVKMPAQYDEKVRQEGRDAAVRWLEAQVSIPEQKVMQAEGYTVRALNPDTQETYAAAPLDYGSAIISIPENSAKILYEVWHGEERVHSVAISAPDCMNAQTFLLFASSN